MREVVSKNGVSFQQTDYAGSRIYRDGQLRFLLGDQDDYLAFPDTLPGRPRSPGRIFLIRDHLGSVRVAADQNGTPRQVNHYYPYGGDLAWNAPISSVTDTTAVIIGPIQPDEPILSQLLPANPFKFIGKEKAAGSGLALYDFGARFYSPSISRWTSPDPMAEKYYSVSPYAYCAGDPVNLVDSDGNSPQVLGALVGAGLDMGLQVATNFIQGEKWYNIDVKSVLISASAGAVGVGIVSKVKQAKHLVDLGKVAVAAGEALTEATVSSAESVVRQYTYNGSVSLEETLTDATIGAGSSLFGSGAKAAKHASSRGKQELKTLMNQHDRAERVARGNNPKASRQAEVEKAKNRVETYGDERKTAVSAATDFMGSTYKEYLYNNEERRNE